MSGCSWLRENWPGPAIPAGSAVRNNMSGGTHKYITLANQTVPNAWTRYEGYIGEWDVNGSGGNNLFPYGTAFVRLLFLNNYTGGTSPTNIIRWSDIWFSEMSSRNLEVATTTRQGVVDTGAQSFAGAKTFTGDVTVPKLIIGAFYLNSLIANNKVPDSDKWDGYQFADYLDQAVKQASNVSFGNITSSGWGIFPSGIRGAAAGAPSHYIWAISGAYTNYGLYFNEGAPDYMEWHWAGVIKAKVNMDSGYWHGARYYFGLAGFYMDSSGLVANNKVVDSDKVDGEHASAIVTKARVDAQACDHGALSGRGDDDHTQYHNNTRGDARYYTQTNLQTSGQSQVHWNNITNEPATYPPEPHTHVGVDIVTLIMEEVFDGLSTGNINGQGTYEWCESWVNTSGAGTSAEVLCKPIYDYGTRTMQSENISGERRTDKPKSGSKYKAKI